MKSTYHDVVTAYNMSKTLLKALMDRDDVGAMDFAIYYDLVNSKPEDNLVHYETLRDIMDRAINYIKEHPDGYGQHKKNNQRSVRQGAKGKGEK